jgi:hypothetical protein
MLVLPPNEWRISCRPSGPRPHKPTFLSPYRSVPPTRSAAPSGLSAACAG